MKLDFTCYIVGAQKAGTTSLYNWLAQHPDVFAPAEAKDFPLFSGDDGGFAQRFSRMQRLYTQSAVRDRRVALGSEANLVFSPRGIQRLAEAAPQCRVVFLVRRPDERCFSAWRYARERGLDNRSFADAIGEELSGQTYCATSYEGRQMNYLDHSRYAGQLEALKSHFSESNILLLPFEIMRDTPAKIMELVCEFLDLKQEVTWDFRASNKTTSGSRSKALNSVLYRERKNMVFALLRFIMSAALRAKIRERLVAWNRSGAVAEWSAPAPEVMQRVRSALADDVRLHEETLANIGARLRDRSFVLK